MVTPSHRCVYCRRRRFAKFIAFTNSRAHCSDDADCNAFLDSLTKSHYDIAQEQEAASQGQEEA